MCWHDQPVPMSHGTYRTGAFFIGQAFVVDFQCASRSAIKSARRRSSRLSRMLRSSGLARK
jgi:hypothetical protein